MSLASQWKTVTNNWLLVVLILVAVFALNFGSIDSVSRSYNAVSESSYAYAQDSYMGGSIMPPTMPYPGSMPDVSERKVTRTASLSSEVPRDTFLAAESRVKQAVTAANAILLYENTGRSGNPDNQYYRGDYTIQVDVKEYAALVTSLKGIGEVQSFSENANDITGEYSNAEINLATERARLARYEAMYAEATLVADKIELSNRIFDQERTVKYLEDAMTNLDERVEYTTVQVSLTEKQSSYAGIAIVKLSELARTFVGSVSSLLVFIMAVLPWALVAAIGYGVWRITHR